MRLALLATIGLLFALSVGLTAILFQDRVITALGQTMLGWLLAAPAGLAALALARDQRRAAARAVAIVRERDQTIRLLAERASDVIFRYRRAPQSGVEYVSPSVERVLGISPERLIHERGLLETLVHPDDTAFLEQLDGAALASSLVMARLRRADGTWVPLEISIGQSPGTAPYDVIEGVARDVTERDRRERELRRVGRIRETLSAVNRSLVRSTTESELLHTVCRAAVEVDGFRFAWVGFVDHKSGQITPAAHAGHEAGYLEQIRVEVADTPLGRGPVGTALRTGQTTVIHDVATDPRMEPWRGAAQDRGYASVAALPLAGRGGVFGVIAIYAAEIDAFDDDEIALLDELAGDLAYGVETLRDRAARVAAERERTLLAAAIDGAGLAIMVLDTKTRIEYVNSAFEHMTGYALGELRGRHPVVLEADDARPTDYLGVWKALKAGGSWVGDLPTRRKDGSVLVTRTIASPVRGRDGRLAGQVVVKRDMTAELVAARRVREQTREKDLVKAALRSLRSDGSPEATAASICRQVAQLADVSSTWLILFSGDGDAIPLAGVTHEGTDASRASIPSSRAAILRDKALTGPWVERWAPTVIHPFAADLRRAGARAVACAPIQVDGSLVGLLEIAGARDISPAALAERLSALVEFADMSGAVLGPTLARRTRRDQRRARISRIIDERAFWPVFQPIVDLRTGDVIGFEALTRFADGTAPDLVFGEAARVGLGGSLELATLAAAVRASEDLPGGSLHLNVSPDMVTATGDLAALLAETRRPVALEITEHEEIADYGAFRDAVAAIAPGLRLSVDDAGAGFSSLRHILELRPDSVKIDRSLVGGLQQDPARQAVVWGFCHLADSLAFTLIAEGIETEEERRVLVSLGVPQGQGWLLGRPAPADQWHGRANLAT